MHRLLVTGGAGFIGSNFVQHWLTNHPGDRVVVLDALTYAGNPMNLASVRHRPEYHFVQGNICDTPLVESLLQQEQLDTIVHFAAESHVDRSIVEPDTFITTNVAGTHCLLKAARKIWMENRSAPMHRFHHVSTDEVYGSLEPSDAPCTESARYAPNSPYSASKAAADHLVRAYHHTYGLNTTISNCSNNYGPFHFREKLIPLTIVNILLGKPLPLYGDGRNVRDWLHVYDHCRALELILTRGCAGEVYNIGSEAQCENIVLVRMLCGIMDDLFGRQPHLAARFPQSPAAQNRSASGLISFVKDRPGHDRRYAIDAAKAREQLGYVPTVRLQEGLRITCEWYCDHEDWWRIPPEPNSTPQAA